MRFAQEKLVTFHWKFYLDERYVRHLTRDSVTNDSIYMFEFFGNEIPQYSNWDALENIKPKHQLTINVLIRSLEEGIL